MRILATSVFERVVYHCYCLDPSEPSRPQLVVDAILRDGDTDGPLLVAMADLKRMLGLATVQANLGRWREAGRTEVQDGVEYLAFPLWERRAL